MLAEEGGAEGRAGGDHQHVALRVVQLEAGAVGAEQQPLFATGIVAQLHQRAEADAALFVVGVQRQLAPGVERLLDFLDAARLADREVGRFQAEGVVFVLGDVLFMGRRFVGGLRRAAGQFEVALQALQQALAQLRLVPAHPLRARLTGRNTSTITSSPSLLNSTRPPKLSHSAFTVGRPRPQPCTSLLVEMK